MGRDSVVVVKSSYIIGEGKITPRGGILYVSMHYLKQSEGDSSPSIESGVSSPGGKMKIELIQYEGVNEDGTFKDRGGAIYTNKGLKYGPPCPCGCSPEHWITLSTGLKDEKVDVISITGEKEELEKVLNILGEIINV